MEGGEGDVGQQSVPPLDTQLEPAELRREVEVLKAKVDSQEVNLSIVSSWSDVLYKDQKSLPEQIHHNSSHLMQNELVIGRIAQGRRENCKQAAITFLQNRVGITVNNRDVWLAYRKGTAVFKVIGGE